MNSNANEIAGPPNNTSSMNRPSRRQPLTCGVKYRFAFEPTGGVQHGLQTQAPQNGPANRASKGLVVLRPSRVSRLQSATLFWFLGLSLIVGLQCGLLQAEETVVYGGVPRGSSIRIDGSSSVHDWTVETKLVSGTLASEGEIPTDLSVSEVPALPSTPRLTVRIVVRTLKSGKPTMDNVMYASMDRDTHPFITYQLREMTPSATERETGDPLVYDTVGDLAVSGITNSITMPISVQPNGEDGLKFVGKTFTKMTDFGIKPPAPRLVFGLIKTGDDVLIRFEWVVKRRTPKAKPAPKPPPAAQETVADEKKVPAPDPVSEDEPGEKSEQSSEKAPPNPDSQKDSI